MPAQQEFCVAIAAEFDQDSMRTDPRAPGEVEETRARNRGKETCRHRWTRTLTRNARADRQHQQTSYRVETDDHRESWVAAP